MRKSTRWHMRTGSFCWAFFIVLFSAAIFSFNPYAISDVFAGAENVETDSEWDELADEAVRLSAQYSGPEPTEEEKEAFLRECEEYEQAYADAKAREQSLANRTLTALSVAAAGIGGMELAMGLSEQKADKEAEQDMAAYLATMRCTYGDGKQVKAGPDEIELPGANDTELMSLRDEYFALAKDLKERKEALGMKPGIESEEIIDKSQTGLYDDESLSIDSGAYASLYRAQMLGSEVDQQKIDENKETSKKRVIGGGVAAGAGVVGGMVGDAVINGDHKKSEKTDKKTLSSRKEVSK